MDEILINILTIWAPAGTAVATVIAAALRMMKSVDSAYKESRKYIDQVKTSEEFILLKERLNAEIAAHQETKMELENLTNQLNIIIDEIKGVKDYMKEKQR